MMKQKKSEILLIILLNFKSKISSLKLLLNYSNIMGCIFIVGSFLLSGCAPQVKSPENFFELTPETAQHKALQIRMFETANEKELLSASAAVLQDLGFQIEESANDVGMFRAVKERGAREYSQEIGQALLFLFGLYGQTIFIIPVDLHQQIAATLSINPSGKREPRFSVRIVFYRTLWKGNGVIGRQEVPPGMQTREMIYDPLIYQQFFAKLAKSVFLEAHQI